MMLYPTLGLQTFTSSDSLSFEDGNDRYVRERYPIER